MKYFVVIDTNVVVSAMLKSDSFPAQVLREVLLGNINLLVNEVSYRKFKAFSRKAVCGNTKRDDGNYRQKIVEHLRI